MRIGVSIPNRRWPDGGPVSYTEMARWAIRADEVGFAEVWAGDHFYTDRDEGGRLPSPDPIALLSFVVGKTEALQVGTMVLCGAFRSPGQVAREARTLAEISNGRFVLGLGSGWHEPEFISFDLPFDHKVSRFAEYLEVTLRLVRGEMVSYEGQYITLRNAEIVGGRTPSVWVAGAGPRVISLAARFADGWSPKGPVALFPQHVETLRREEAAAGRQPRSVATAVGHRVLVLSRAEKKSLFGNEEPDFPVTAEEIVASVDDYRAAGWDHLTLHLAGRIWAGYQEEQLERVAEVLDLTGLAPRPA
jgi:alkanesulfonate monooxygenase SsuD/methylene tetrahydromethanopterin reductase-like flavin-dependent oxidoreductase (luciferase family)